MKNSSRWLQDAVIYELHVRSFYDSNRDGIGDFPGLTERLGYLKDLGVNTLWLLPFFPSPMKTQGHDITDFMDVHPSYGTLEDFRRFLDEAHRLGLRVVIDLVINHTSVLHPWFERARRAAPGTPERDFYIWSDTPSKFQDARIIYKDFETSNWSWDPTAGSYYWHRFFSQQPDLNFDHPEVRRAIRDVVDFWLKMGVDGLRLKGTSYLYAREGTSCENLPEGHAFLKQLRRHVDRKYTDRALLARPKLWPEEVASYFGKGDECHGTFNVPLAPRMFLALAQEDRFPVLDVFSQTAPAPQSGRWLNFLRDHDDLSLEMVTDEDRDTLFRAYARHRNAQVNMGIRRRLAPLLGNDRRKMELMQGLLFSFPGSPVIYYGDEIGMGDNFFLPDRNGLRTPFQWTSGRNAGFSRAPNSQTLFLPVITDPEFHYETLNVEAQQRNPSSFLLWLKRLIAVHREAIALREGSIQFLEPENRKILAFIRKHENETILVVANLSSLAQFVELDLSEFDGMTPIELFGRTAFPRIGSLPYFVTLAPHAFQWFSLSEAGARATSQALTVSGNWSLDQGFSEELWAALEQVLPTTIQRFRWFGAKSRPIRSATVTEKIPVGSAFLALVAIEYVSGEPDLYALPLELASGKKAAKTRKESQDQIFLEMPDGSLVQDATASPDFRSAFLRAILESTSLQGSAGQATPSLTRAAQHSKKKAGIPASEVLRGEQSNTSIRYGSDYILKLYRRTAEGVNPDVEIGRYLTDRTAFKNIPRAIGTLEYMRKDQEPMTLASLHSFLPNQGDAWKLFMELLQDFTPGLNTRRGTPPEAPLHPLEGARKALPRAVLANFEPFLSMATLLGRRTMEMHLALAETAAGVPDPAFTPVPFTLFNQRALYQSMRQQTDAVLLGLKGTLRRLPENIRGDAVTLLKSASRLDGRFRELLGQRIDGLRTRTHGDYHLGQVLFTGKDFVIIDFEGEPARSLSARKFKRSPLRDVAGMLRSFHYASSVAVGDLHSPTIKEATARKQWLASWHGWVCTAYLRGYLEQRARATFLPTSEPAIRLLLDVHLLEKALYELSYEMNNRPEWVHVPLSGILELLEETPFETHSRKKSSKRKRR